MSKYQALYGGDTVDLLANTIEEAEAIMKYADFYYGSSRFPWDTTIDVHQLNYTFYRYEVLQKRERIYLDKTLLFLIEVT